MPLKAKAPMAFSLIVCAALAMGALAACGDDGGESSVDQGVVKPWPIEENSFGEVLKMQDKPEAGWLSAPWGLGQEVNQDSRTVSIVYVAGDTQCYGPAGFTLVETKNRVIIGAYTIAVTPDDDASPEPCPDSPARAWKYGTVQLAEPLGNRQLAHAPVNALYADYTWPEMQPPATSQPADDESAEPDEPLDLNPPASEG